MPRDGTGCPRVVVPDVGSMRPRLPVGARMRVVPLTAEPDVGDMVLFRGRRRWLVHRVVAGATFRNGRHLFHQGDDGVTCGLARAEDAVGRVAGVIWPREARFLAVADLPPEARRRFAQAQRRCRAFALLRRGIERLGHPRTGVAWLLRAALRRARGARGGRP